MRFSIASLSLSRTFALIARAAGRAWTWSVWLVVALLFGVVLGTLAGCVDLEQVRQERKKGEEVVATLKSRGTEYQSTLIGLSQSDPARAELEEGVQRVVAAREEVARRVQAAAALEEELRRGAKTHASVGNGSGEPVGGLGEGSIVVGGTDLMDLIPGPWKVAAVLSVGLATSLVRSRQLREAASSIARSIDKALAEDAELAERFRQHANTLRTIQTPLAQRIVDEGQR